MIVKTDAIVLKSMRFRDTSKIVTFYSSEFGKLKAIAKGARETKSKFGASLEPMTKVALVVYKKENRDLQLVSQCDILKPYKRIHSDMVRMSVAMGILELVHQVTHHEEQNRPLFGLVEQCLATLDQSEGNCDSIMFAFQMKFVSLLGFHPSLDRCVLCGEALRSFHEDEYAVFQTGLGTVLCPSCAKKPQQYQSAREKAGDGVHKTTVQTLKLLQMFLDSSIDEIPVVENMNIRNEIDETLHLYLRHHFEGLRPLQSKKVFQNILR